MARERRQQKAASNQRDLFLNLTKGTHFDVRKGKEAKDHNVSFAINV